MSDSRYCIETGRSGVAVTIALAVWESVECETCWFKPRPQYLGANTLDTPRFSPLADRCSGMSNQLSHPLATTPPHTCRHPRELDDVWPRPATGTASIRITIWRTYWKGYCVGMKGSGSALRVGRFGGNGISRVTPAFNYQQQQALNLHYRLAPPRSIDPFQR